MTRFRKPWVFAMSLSVMLASAASAQDAGLRIVVLAGEDSVNIIEQGTAVPTLVEVRDRNDLPVSGASVLFLLGEGGTATLNAGLSQVALTTNALGQAAVTVNPVASGAVQLSVNATFQGQTAAAAIAQTNFATVAEAAAAGVSATGGAGGGAGGAGVGTGGAGAGAGGGTGAAGGAAAGGAGAGGLGTGAIVGIAGAAAGAAVGVGAATGGDDPPTPEPEPPSTSAPSAPLPPTLTVGDGELSASWNVPSDNGAAIDDYDVRYRPAGGSWANLPDAVKSTSTTATVTGLVNGTSYDVQVRAGNSIGDGPWSRSARGTPASSASVPSAPSPPVLEAGGGQLTAEWTAPADNGAAIDDYDVRYRPVGDNWTELPDTVKSTATSATLTGLTNGTTYEVQVRAGNSVGDGPWSASATGTPVVEEYELTLTDVRFDRVEDAGDGSNWLYWVSVTARNTGPLSIEHSNESQPALFANFYDENGPVGGVSQGIGFHNGVWSPGEERTGTGFQSIATDNRSNVAYYRFRLEQGTHPEPIRCIGCDEEYRDVPRISDQESPDRAVLVEFYNATNGPNWTNNTNWNSSAPLVQWHGVSVGANGRVNRLDLRLNQLTGSVPGSLGSLTNLQVLSLSDNQLSGSIPDSLASLANLRVLDLGRNRLTGSIPSFLGSLSNLQNLVLQVNQLSGSIPSSLGSLTNLQVLNLGDNQLSGSIPSSLGSLTNLRTLRLGNGGGDRSVFNQLSGSIPSSLGNLTNLRSLHLRSNQLSGSIPSSLGNLTNLRSLDLGNNFIYPSLNQLSGSIPSSLGSLTNLQSLLLDNNQLSGSIPASLGSLANLERLWLRFNQLTGSIPAPLCQFEDTINPQQGDVNLPCASSSATAQSLVTLSVGDARVEEAAGAAVAFAVTLSRAATEPVTVDYATGDGSAKAGEDYVATGGTLTFAAGETSKTVSVAVLDDAHDEGEETFVLALSNPSGVRLEDAEATGTIENADALPAALIARFGRASAEHVVEHVEERLAAPREPGFRARFAGRDVGPGMERDFALDFLSQLGGGAGMDPMGASPMGVNPMGGSAMGSHMSGAGVGGPGMAGHDLHMGGAAFLRGHGASGRVDFAGSALPGGDLLSGSEFELNRAERGGVLSVWSRGARSSFGGRQGALSLNGDVRTTMLGADYSRGRLVAGLSLARSRGLGGYDGRHAGQVESSATGLYPWLGYRVNDRVTVWGVTGYGVGAMRLAPDGAAALESGLSMAMAAAATRGELLGSRSSGGFALAFKADALWVGTSVEGVDGPAGRLSASDAAVTRIRTALEGSRGFALGGRMSLTPSVEVGLRQDGGDAETGTGVDVGGGLSFTDALTGLSLDVRVRTLVAHQAAGFTERGMSLSLGWDPTPSSPLGFGARVAPSWGGDVQGSEALWRGGPLSQLGAYGGQPSAGRLDAELGYGLPVGRRLVGTPRVGFGSSAYGRAYQFG